MKNIAVMATVGLATVSVSFVLVGCSSATKTDKPATPKPATLETGYTLNVPLFVNEGDRIRVDTRTGEYMERV